jgi:hypothetical protein
MVPAADEVHAVLTIDGNTCHIAVNITLGQLLPSLDDRILDLAWLVHAFAPPW